MQLSANAAFQSGSFTLNQLAGLAGPFWQYFYEGQDSLRDLLETSRQQHRQSLRVLTEVASLADFNNPPLFHTETFFPIRVPVSKVTATPLRYGDDAQYGPPSGTELYGQTDQLGWSFPVPDTLVGATALLDRPFNSRFSATIETSAWFIGGEIEMRADPATVFQQIEYNGEPHYLVWAYMAKFDQRFLTKRYGPLLGQSFTSAQPQALAIRYAMNSLINGATEYYLRGTLAAAVGEEIAVAGEKVDRIVMGYGRYNIFTDLRTINGQDGANPVVSSGDILKAGDFFFDTVKMSAPPNFPAWLASVTLPRGLTKGDELVLLAGDLAATAETRDGKLYVYPTATGDSAFWSAANNHNPSLAAGIAATYNLNVANPDTASPVLVPAQVDFASVLFRYVFGYKLSVSLLSSAHLVPGAVEILRLIRLITPPWVRHIIEFTGDPPDGWLSDVIECC